MEKLFYKKPVAILVVALVMVLVFLLCMLLVTLTQLSSLKATVSRLESMVLEARNDEQAKQDLIEYRKTNDFVIEWAISRNMIRDDVVNYIQQLEK